MLWFRILDLTFLLQEDESSLNLSALLFREVPNSPPCALSMAKGEWPYHQTEFCLKTEKKIKSANKSSWIILQPKS